MQETLSNIVNIIERNRISSTEVADALGKRGVIDGILPINTGKHIAGKVSYIYAFDESNWPVHEQAMSVEEDTVLFVDSFNCNNKAVFGDLVSKYLLLYKRVKGVVINGLMRDIPNIRKHQYAIWCTGYTPLGCFNKPVKESEELLQQVAARRKMFEGGVLTCDDSGCTLIGKDEITEETLKKLDLIELQEDIWFYCIDTLKWSTYDTVCLKRYLTEQDVLPPILRERIKDIPFKA
jgi:regulator of RNase E activity RraA